MAELLLVDIGNTAVKIAPVKAGRLMSADALAHGRQAKNIGHFVLDHLDVSAQVHISSVLPDKSNEEIRSLLQSRGVNAHWFSAGCKNGLFQNHYQPAESLGIDRWLAMAGAVDGADSAVLVIDCGTATTVDLVDSHRIYRGGLILPPEGQTLDGLLQLTGLQPERIEAEDIFGLSTWSCLQLGQTFDDLDGICRFARAAMPEGLEIKVCGGSAPEACRQIGADGAMIPDLLFRGMLALL